ncbi:GGDEF domain-containing response regulator [Desulfobulbus alkaliphilus]|uniref:GGDEF domain-containing response regulator n=1 Tax=Desulfobulbus alkaliphilus TaxID=869814 RepID=UPI00196285BD|nr:diguanylate cyclase [Desulfobulbus alkaliphilus]MBM9536348.1 diguanylate cyclase [Desulfobulbus alkaliphilus]
MRILIAEDDFTSRAMLAAVLRKSGHEVLEAGNGAEAWEMLQQPQAPKLVIVDWMMPELDGLELVRLVRSLPTDHPPYLIMLTAKGEKADIITGLDAGANDYLGKPFDPGELRARVEVGSRMIEMQAALIASREALVHQATRDPLTGMFNRRAILDHLDKELAHARRHGELLAVGMCDIDHFKRINDTHGHQTGDEVLCSLTQIFKHSLRQHDTVGRMGGEEFLVVSTMQAGADCRLPFDRIRQLVADSRIATRSGDLAITLSIGVALAGSGATVDTLLEASDLALYRAKGAGRNRVVLAQDQEDTPISLPGEDAP